MTSKFHLQLWKDPESSLDDPSRHSKLSRSSTRSFLLCQSDARFSQNARIKHTTSPYKIDHWHLRHNTHTTERKFTSLAVNKKKNFANLITHLFIYIRRYEWVNVSRQGQAKLKSGISNCPTNETGNRGNPSRNSHSQARSWNRPAARAASSTRASPPPLPLIIRFRGETERECQALSKASARYCRDRVAAILRMAESELHVKPCTRACTPHVRQGIIKHDELVDSGGGGRVVKRGVPVSPGPVSYCRGILRRVS